MSSGQSRIGKLGYFYRAIKIVHMALPPMEIRYSRRAFYLVIFFCMLWVVLMTGMTYFLSRDLHTMIPYFTHSIMILTVGIILGWATRTLWDNRPVLTFHSHGLQLHGRKQIFIAWGAITKWKIRSTKGGYYLDIRTADQKKSIPLNMLERSSKTIEELMQTYIRQPGPGGFQR
jgi:hypothetical protein